jgi:ATP synthase protein I
MQPRDHLRAKQVLVTQVLLTMVLSAAALVVGPHIALSVLIGAGAGTLANGFFAFWVFRQYRAQEPERLVMRFFGAELAKIALLMSVFSLAFLALDSLNIPVLLTAFLLIQVIGPVVGSRFGVG